MDGDIDRDMDRDRDENSNENSKEHGGQKVSNFKLLQCQKYA
jgi:hypothetical protein